MEAVERVSGLRGAACPWWEAQDAFVRAVSTAHAHWSTGELATRLGRPAPEALMRGIEVWNQALNAIQGFDIKNPTQVQQQPSQPQRGVRVQREPVHAARRAKR